MIFISIFYDIIVYRNGWNFLGSDMYAKGTI